MSRKAPWPIFYKCFQNQATSEELAEIDNWLGEDTENIKMLEEIYGIYSISPVLPSPLIPNTERAWRNVDRKTSINKGFIKRLPYQFTYAVAAVASVIIASVIIFGVINNFRKREFANQFTEVITPGGQKTSVLLPDSSLVWLNSSSSLKYSRNFNSEERELLLEGEAFFEVKRNISKKFRVKSAFLNVEVYGTAFNIRNYPGDSTQAITVVEGIVGISDQNKEIRRLLKGEQALLNKISGEIIFSHEDTDLITAWKNNELIFRNKPLEEVIKYLERWYGVNITIDDKLKGKHNYTFRVKTESFREVLDMMKIMTPLNYKINGNDVTIWYQN